MSKHKYYDMIVAKAENTELSVLLRVSGGAWREYECGGFPAFSNGDYFLCLPKHKEACLHWLNGGDVLAVRFDNQMPDSGVMIDSELTDLDDDVNSYPWKLHHVFMDEAQTIVIKPRKEKRWVCITDDLEIEDGTLYESYADADENSPGYKQIVEIEVEI